jgi:hypothetical protein
MTCRKPTDVYAGGYYCGQVRKREGRTVWEWSVDGRLWRGSLKTKARAVACLLQHYEIESELYLNIVREIKQERVHYK